MDKWLVVHIGLFDQCISCYDRDHLCRDVGEQLAANVSKYFSEVIYVFIWYVESYKDSVEVNSIFSYLIQFREDIPLQLPISRNKTLSVTSL